ncbi:MAG: YjbQ family protein [Bacteroidales bacterium]|nr:YjbQ family protein [Bacteroidales bacterium]
MVRQIQFSLPPFPKGYHLITLLILEKAGTLPAEGVMHIFIQHTSAGLTLNENADPTVRRDFETFMNDLVPEDYPRFMHTLEGSDDMPAHLKSAILGASVSVPISNHRLNLGTWQGIYLCEFRRHGGPRRIVVTIMGE